MPNTQALEPTQQLRVVAAELPDPAGRVEPYLGQAPSLARQDTRVVNRRVSEVITVPVEFTIAQHNKINVWAFKGDLHVDDWRNLHGDALRKFLQGACGALYLELHGQTGNAAHVTAYFGKGSRS